MVVRVSELLCEVDLSDARRRLLYPTPRPPPSLNSSKLLLCFLMVSRRTSDSIPLRQASTGSSRRRSSFDYSGDEEEGSAGAGSGSESEGERKTASTSRQSIRRSFSSGKRQPRRTPSPSPDPSEDESKSSFSSSHPSSDDDDKPLNGRPAFWMTKRTSFRQIYLRSSRTLGLFFGARSLTPSDHSNRCHLARRDHYRHYFHRQTLPKQVVGYDFFEFFLRLVRLRP
ncbi:hypothetical protein BCR35DRAFT_43631 [Leucosporidium creatinivorum]|uniref:Uncharacterized protein n=1 Tax=Leucosporidium creatinivorum TaxID=106004 RepID=A0A1Y2FVB7_9BASI|nr:hypothetical protein BCR35DRAFT_43631 [Leucosporidium creatinivorum]